jgi:hypothetical protein
LPVKQKEMPPNISSWQLGCKTEIPGVSPVFTFQAQCRKECETSIPKYNETATKSRNSSP